MRVFARTAWAVMVTLAIAGSASGAPLVLKTLSGESAGGLASPGVTVVAFWRADCAPCRLEMRAARDYALAAQPGRFLFVGLQDGEALRAAADKEGAPPAMLLRAVGSPASILATYGGTPPRLPLAVAFTASGRVCARRHGLLGTDRITAWVRNCGTSHAQR
jgi:hypothetical protein